MKTMPFGYMFNKSCLGRNKMATIFKMATLNIIFRHWSSLLVYCFKNVVSDFKNDYKSGNNLLLVK